MIKKKEVYYVQRDSCGYILQDIYEDGEESTAYFETRDSLVDYLSEINWFEHEGKVICCDCILEATAPIEEH